MNRTPASACWLTCTLAIGLGALAGCSDEPTATPTPHETAVSSTHMGDSDGENSVEPGQLTAMIGSLGSTMQDPLGLDASSQSLPEDLRDPLLANQTTTTPFPERTDPFEFGKGVVFDVPAGSDNEAQNIRLYGFAGADQPKAIINIDGKTKMLSAGEKWGVVEVLEVSPPTVRIKANGIARVWSLLGHHEQNGL
ncbi:MAG: hypothetical protein IT422_17655 [Pirellulaceae bacterium]|nr:hypothetical protein [Pirellulaceae bacterium]